MGRRGGVRLRPRLDLRPPRVEVARDGPWFATIPTLTAAAMATDPDPARHVRRVAELPPPGAVREAGDDPLLRLGGRLTAGIGAGGTGWDAEMLGADPWSRAERSERFSEFVALTDELLRNPASASSTGRY